MLAEARRAVQLGVETGRDAGSADQHSRRRATAAARTDGAQVAARFRQPEDLALGQERDEPGRQSEEGEAGEGQHPFGVSRQVSFEVCGLQELHEQEWFLERTFKKLELFLTKLLITDKTIKF